MGDHYELWLLNKGGPKFLRPQYLTVGEKRGGDEVSSVGVRYVHEVESACLLCCLKNRVN